MINLQLTVREAMELSFYAREDIRERITQAFEVALGVNQRCTVTITSGMNMDNRIGCIKAIRLHSGWGLKESKDWTDVLVGGWKYDKWYPAKTGTTNSLTLKTPEAAENLLNELVRLGCQGYLS